MADTRLQELAENQDCSPDAKARAEAPARVEPAYRRDNLPNLDSLPVAVRLKAGLVTGIVSVAASMLLVWALAAAATLATARPETINLSLGYVFWFPVRTLESFQAWVASTLLITAGFWGLWKPQRRYPETLSLLLWPILTFAIALPFLADGRVNAISKSVAFILVALHSGFAAVIFFLIFRKAREMLIKVDRIATKPSSKESRTEP